MLATSVIFIQLLIVSTCFFIVTAVSPTIISSINWSGFILIGFLISIIFSEISYAKNYYSLRPTHLIQIEEVLSKKSKNANDLKPSFFREEGFLWIDFKEGITTERKETKDIIKRLKTENSVIIVGDQASGKSNILRNLGYQLVNDGFIVFFINADSLDLKCALSDIRNWDMSNVVIIIDDVHRNVIMVSDFLNRVHSNSVKVVLSSRPANFSILRERNGQRLLSILDKKVEVKVTEEIIQDMVLKYASVKDEHFKVKISEVNFEVIKEIIQKCGTDLWLITYLLLAWNPKETSIKDVAKTDIFQKVYESRISHLEINDRNSLRAMETICILYQFEIPCSEAYLIEMDLNKTAIELVLKGFLIKRGTYYYLHHPSVAKIYLDTFVHYHLVDNVTDLSIIILSSYLEKNKEDRAQVFYKLSTFPKSIEKRDEILKVILQQSRIEDIIDEVEQEENLEKIDFFFQSLASVDINYAKEILRRLSLDEFLRKFLFQPFVRQQKNLIHDLSQIDSAIAKLLSQKRPKVVLLFPAYNEEHFIGYIQDAFDFVDDVIVIDDGSTDCTAKIASEIGARVISHSENMGYLSSVQSGLEEIINEEIDIVILASEFLIARAIPNLIGPVMRQEADLTVGYYKLPWSGYGLEWVYFQAMNRKAVEKFLKYFSAFRDSKFPFSDTSVLFSKILHVERLNVFTGKTLTKDDLIENNFRWMMLRLRLRMTIEVIIRKLPDSIRWTIMDIINAEERFMRNTEMRLVKNKE